MLCYQCHGGSRWFSSCPPVHKASCCILLMHVCWVQMYFLPYNLTGIACWKSVLMKRAEYVVILSICRVTRGSAHAGLRMIPA